MRSAKKPQIIRISSEEAQRYLDTPLASQTLSTSNPQLFAQQWKQLAHTPTLKTPEPTAATPAPTHRFDPALQPHLNAKIGLLHVYRQWLRTHPPTQRDVRHHCEKQSLECVLQSFGEDEIYICQRSGNAHLCGVNFCPSLIETRECLTCTRTGHTFLLDKQADETEEMHITPVVVHKEKPHARTPRFVNLTDERITKQRQEVFIHVTTTILSTTGFRASHSVLSMLSRMVDRLWCLMVKSTLFPQHQSTYNAEYHCLTGLYEAREGLMHRIVEGDTVHEFEIIKCYTLLQEHMPLRSQCKPFESSLLTRTQRRFKTLLAGCSLALLRQFTAS